MAKFVVLLLLLSLSLCCAVALRTRNHERGSYASNKSIRQQRNSLRGFDDEISGAVEIAGSFTGHLDALATSNLYYILLDSHQVADFNVHWDSFNYSVNQLGATMIYLAGTSLEWELDGTVPSWANGDVTSSQPISPSNPVPSDFSTLAAHCSEFPAKYYFQFSSYDTNSGANFTLNITKRSSDITLSSGTYQGTAYFPQSGYIGFSVTEQCGQLVFDVTTEDVTGGGISASDLFMSYKCQDPEYAQECVVAGLNPNIVYQLLGTIPDTQKRLQYYVNCTSPGTYYLSYSGFGARIYYNVTTYTSYPCPSGCWNTGLCDMDNGTCLCLPGWMGDNCSIPTSTPTPPPTTTFTEVVIPTDGTIVTITKANMLAGDTMLQIDTDNGVTGKVIRATFSVNISGRGDSISMYFNQGANATVNGDNYVGYLAINTNVPGIDSTDVLLGAGNGAWYVFVHGQVVTDDLNVKVIIEDIPVVTSTFSGSVPASYDVNYPMVFQFNASPSTQVILQVNETNPQLIEIAINRSVNMYLDDKIRFQAFNSPDVRQEGPGIGRFGISYMPSTVGPVYFYILAMPGTNFTASVTVVDSTEKFDCGGLCKGTCMPGNYCICPVGYTGTNCDQVQLPAGYIQLTSGNNTLNLPGGTFFTSLTYANLHVPAGSSVFMGVTYSTRNTEMFIARDAFPYASPENSPQFNLATQDTGYYLFDTCAHRKASDLNFAFTGQMNQVNLTFINSNIIPSDGKTYTVSMTSALSGLLSYPSSDCTKAYYVVVETTATLNRITLGEGQTQCYDVFRDTMNGYSNGTYSYLLSMQNCSNGIDLSVIGTNDIYDVLNISITPTTACPNGCSGAENGVCILGGTCECYYPWIDDDCSVYDYQCTTVLSSGPCQSTIPSTYTFFDDIDNYCDVQYAEYQVPGYVSEIEGILLNNGISLSASCQAELTQIMCDLTFYKCQTQPGGGVKQMLPCNGLTWIQRCAPAYASDPESLGVYDDYLVVLQDEVNLPYYVCNPSFNSTSTTSTTSTTTQSTTAPTTQSTITSSGTSQSTTSTSSTSQSTTSQASTSSTSQSTSSKSSSTSQATTSSPTSSSSTSTTHQVNAASTGSFPIFLSLCVLAIVVLA